MNYGHELDARDTEILAKSQADFDTHSGPRVGDFVWLPGETAPRRFTYEWSDGLQTTVGPQSPCHGHVSFFINGGFANFSGSLDDAIPRNRIVDTGDTRAGNVWFFHHGIPGAGRGTYTQATFRVYRVAETGEQQA